MNSVSIGSVVDVVCETRPLTNPARSASPEWSNVELATSAVYIVSGAARLPVTATDSATSIAADVAIRAKSSATLTDIVSASSSSSPTPSPASAPTAATSGAAAAATAAASVRLDTRLDHRVVDARAPEVAAAFALSSVAELAFTRHCGDAGFTGIRTPKLLAGASEGGSDVFKLNYFGRDATLAQSPQLSKQMALMSDVSGGRGVYEVGPVFRAEKSHTHRHLCEFTSMDVELGIDTSVDDVVAFAETTFVTCISAMQAAEGAVRWTSPPCRLTLSDNKQRALQTPTADGALPDVSCSAEPGAPAVLRVSFTHAAALISSAVDAMGSAAAAAIGATRQDPLADLTSANERLLGAIVADRYGVDLFSVLRFPTAVRAFYSMPSAGSGTYCESFDMFLRGEEVCSGAQRIHDSALLTEVLTARGIDAEPLRAYIDAFRYGAWPHGGFAIGLERLVMLYMGLNNVRNVVLFPRDPKRLVP